MLTESIESRRTRIKWHQKLFDKSVIRRARLKRLEGLLDLSSEHVCLAVGGDPVMQERLRARGGKWHSIVWEDEAGIMLQDILLEQVATLAGTKLPYEDGQFDRIVILGGLERLDEDHAFVADCHRALKNTGILVICASHAKRWGIVPSLKRLLEMTTTQKEWVRPGYTESQLFEILKDGFDVEVVQTFSRFLVELVDTLLQFLGGYVFGEGGNGNKPQDETDISEQTYQKAYRYFSIVYPIAWIASKLDVLLFFARGYTLVAKARRRIWKPRTVPVLADGRSLAEATLRTKSGTAAPF